MKAAWLALLPLLMLGCAERDSGTENPLAEVPEHEAASPEQAPPARRALWVLAEGSERVLENPDRSERLIERSAQAGITDLFVQVYRRGRSWYRSSHADDRPFREDATGRGELEPSALQTLIASAHARGIRVHAWFNVLALAGNLEAPLLKTIGPHAVLVDRDGRSLLDYPNHDLPLPDRLHSRLGTPGIYLDPAVAEVVTYLEGTLDDLILAAPELDGLHLDYIRHPLALPIVPGSRFDVGFDFGYGDEAKRRFQAETGRSFARGDAWDDFRRERVNELVRRLGARIPETWEYSAAVLPWADRAYLSAMQDWRRWLEEGWLDFVVAMAYTRDDRLFHYLAHDLTGGIGGERVWLGLGVWLFLSAPERIQAQIDRALAAQPSGVALFSYDALAGRPELLDGILWERP